MQEKKSTECFEEQMRITLKEILVESVNIIDKGKNKLLISCIIAICFVSLLFSATMWHMIDEMYNYDYPDMENTNTNTNINGME